LYERQRGQTGPRFEIVLVRFDHGALFIVNANLGPMRPAEELCITDRSFRILIHKRPNGKASEIKLNPRPSLRGRTS
jgi:hypothetical protein